MKIIRAKSAGFCFGVRRAYDLALRRGSGQVLRNSGQASKKRDGSVATLGELIHNPEVLEELSARGVKTLSAVSKAREGVVIIRAHGISDKKLCQLKKQKVEIVDASCPFVKKIHAEVRRFIAQKIPVLIVGRRSHPEMRAVIEDFPEVMVVSRISEKSIRKFLERNPSQPVPNPPARSARFPLCERGSKWSLPSFASLRRAGRGFSKGGSSNVVGVLAQTTETEERFERVVELLKKLKAKVIARRTICGATQERQNAAVELAHRVDLMLVIGGKKSNNTRQLFTLVKKIVPSHWIENEKNIRKSWFAGVKTVGISAGASTPEKTIKKVEEKIGKFKNSRD